MLQLEIVKKHLAAFSAGNWAEYKAGLASDVVYEEIASRKHVEGADACVEAMRRWKRSFPDLKATVVSGVSIGDKVAVEVELKGTNTGPIEGPFGTFPPSNRSGTLKVAVFYTVRNGRILEVHQYFDTLTILGNVGIAPPIGKAVQPPASAASAPSMLHS